MRFALIELSRKVVIHSRRGTEGGKHREKSLPATFGIELNAIEKCERGKYANLKLYGLVIFDEFD